MAGALKLQHLNRMDVDPSGKIVSEERLLGALDVRIRALVQSAEGWLYFSSDDGWIFRVRPVG